MLLFLLLFPFYLLSAKEFYCPHHCGGWGSPSIQQIEWEFVQCMYDADWITAFSEANFWEAYYNDEFSESQPVVPIFYERPKDFSSEWYQKMLEGYSYSRLFPSNSYYYCEGEWGVFWKIRHINDANGNHLGKYFLRKRCTESWFNGI